MRPSPARRGRIHAACSLHRFQRRRDRERGFDARFAQGAQHARQACAPGRDVEGARGVPGSGLGREQHAIGPHLQRALQQRGHGRDPQLELTRAAPQIPQLGGPDRREILAHADAQPIRAGEIGERRRGDQPRRQARTRARSHHGVERNAKRARHPHAPASARFKPSASSFAYSRHAQLVLALDHDARLRLGAAVADQHAAAARRARARPARAAAAQLGQRFERALLRDARR